jgi:hypothetical protein
VLGVANLLVLRLYIGPALRPYEMGDAHLLALALALTLVELRVARALARRPDLVSTLGLASEAAAGLILAVLCTHYLADPNVADIRPLRFVISGSMALLAALYFRRAATLSDADRTLTPAACHALYHFGVTLALWCYALLIPWLRHPSTVLVALGMPVFYFYARAEGDRDPETARRHRLSAATLGLLVLALYAFRWSLQMVAFPDTPIHTEHYHYNAPLVIAIGLVLLRLHALGGSDWLAFYGGLGVVVGSYFGVTALPGWSPFDAPLRAAWCAVGLAHFWAAATYQRSPLRAAIQSMAGIDATLWLSLRHYWGLCVLAALHVVAAIALVDLRTSSFYCAPLLVGVATVVLHQGILRASVVYYVITAVELTAALHADFVTPSYLPRDRVVWVLLGIWVVALVVGEVETRLRAALTPAAVALALLTFAHVLYHGPGSDAGLWAFAGLTALALVTPARGSFPESIGAWIAVVFTLAAPTWLTFWSHSGWETGRLDVHTRTVLLTLTAILATGTAAFLYAWQQKSWHTQAWLGATRLVHHLLAVAHRYGATLRTVVLLVSFVPALLLQIVHYPYAYAPRDFVLFVLLYAAFLVLWRDEGVRRRSMAAHGAVHLTAVALLALVRRQLLLTVGFWTYEYDIWLTLGASMLLAGAKSWVDERPREERVPVLVSLLALPVAGLSWTLIHGLGTDTALLVIGVQSLLFAFLGRDDRESPYHVVALSGFVAFVCLVFWSKLHLRALHAYVIPVGLAILVLVQMFADRLEAGLRNQIRTIALLAMLGSSAYYSLVDERYPLAFHAVVLALGLLAMAVGGLMRIRVYLILGFTGVLVDLAALMAKALIHLDRGPRMMALGAVVLTAGVGLVGGAVYYKTHRERIFAWLESWRPRLATWE